MISHFFHGFVVIYIFCFSRSKIVFLSSINDVRPDPFSSPGELFLSTTNRVKSNYEKALNVGVFQQSKRY